MRAFTAVVSTLLVLTGCAAPTQQVAMGVTDASSATRSIVLTLELVDDDRLTLPAARTAVTSDVTALVKAQSRLEHAAVPSADDGRVQDEASVAVGQALSVARLAQRTLDAGPPDDLAALRARVDRAADLLDDVAATAGPPR